MGVINVKGYLDNKVLYILKAYVPHVKCEEYQQEKSY